MLEEMVKAIIKKSIAADYPHLKPRRRIRHHRLGGKERRL